MDLLLMVSEAIDSDDEFYDDSGNEDYETPLRELQSNRSSSLSLMKTVITMASSLRRKRKRRVWVKVRRKLTKKQNKFF